MLFTFTGGSGHFEPLVPIAHAAVGRGHTATFSCRSTMVAEVEARGFSASATVTPVGGLPPSPRRMPLLALSAEREDRVLREVFAGSNARARADGILALCADQRPDVIVRDEIDFGCAVAAERLGLPCATVLVTAAGFVRAHVVGEPLQVLRTHHGLPADPDLTMLSRGLVLCAFPPSLRDPDYPLPATAHSLRLPPPEPSDCVAPAWLGRLDDVPAVYVTLGTAFNLEAGDLLSRVLAGLAELPVVVAVTVGRQIDPDELGPQPANVHIERYVEQSLVLPRCSAVVSHGGSGTVIGALSHALPSVIVPMGADQPLNARRCRALGAARVLDALHATPADVRDAVREVLTVASYRDAARAARDEIDRLPGPESAVDLLERLAGQ